MQTKKLVLITILITLALIHNVNAETGNTNSNVSESGANASFMNMTETDYANETKDEGAITDKLNIDAPETVEAGKEYKIKVTDKQGNPAEDIKLDIFISESLMTVTTNKEGIAKITPKTSGKIDGIFAFEATESGGETVKWDGNETPKTNETVKDSKKPSDQEPNHNNYIIIAIIGIAIFVSAIVIWYKKFKR